MKTEIDNLQSELDQSNKEKREMKQQAKDLRKELEETKMKFNKLRMDYEEQAELHNQILVGFFKLLYIQNFGKISNLKFLKKNITFFFEID